MKEQNREFFRIELYDTALHIESEKDDYRGEIVDISAKGMLYKVDRDLDEEENMDQLRYTFELMKKPFTVQGKLVRKEEIGPSEYRFAVEFVGLTEKIQARMVSLLLRMDAIRSRRDRETDE